jgi:hypothetical protein
MFDEAPVDLAPLERDMQLRTQRLTTALARRVLRDSARNALGRWAAAAWLAAAASVAAVFIGHDQPTNDAFAAFVIPHQPAAGWVAAGRPPDLAEVLIVASSGR